MFGLSPAHLVIILIILLLVVGPGKLPETGAALGRAIRGFKDAVESADPQAMPPAQAQAPQPATQQVPVQTAQPVAAPVAAPVAQNLPPAGSPHDPTVSI